MDKSRSSTELTLAGEEKKGSITTTLPTERTQIAFEVSESELENISSASTQITWFSSLATTSLSIFTGVAVSFLTLEELTKREGVLLGCFVLLGVLVAVGFSVFAVLAHRRRSDQLRTIRQGAKIRGSHDSIG